MDEYFRKRRQKTLYSGELDPDHNPLALTELAVEYFQDLAPRKLGHVDLQSASMITSQDTVSPSSVTMSMIYAKRLQRKRPEYIQKMNSSDLFLISMMMASKYLYDEGVDEEVFNDEWAETAGLEKEEVNQMEMDFLDALEWEMFLQKDDFEQAMDNVEKRIALKEGLKRGWFSYTDLSLFLGDAKIQLSLSDVGLEWLKVVAVSSAAYLASVLTMVGATVLVTNTDLVVSTLHSSLPLAALPSSSSLPPALLPPDLNSLPFGDLSPPPLPALMGFQENQTQEEGERKAPAQSSPAEAESVRSESVLDTIMSQLMAVLTLKSHLLQFVSAVSDGMQTNLDRRNSSSRKGAFSGGRNRSYSGSRADPPDYQRSTNDDENNLGMKSHPEDDALISSYLGLESAMSLESLVGRDSCTCCGNEAKIMESGLNRDLYDVLWNGRVCACLGESRWRGGRGIGGLLSPGRGPFERPGPSLGRSCYSTSFLNIDGRQQCAEDAMADRASLFPDISIGFATSMPATVLAT